MNETYLMVGLLWSIVGLWTVQFAKAFKDIEFVPSNRIEFWQTRARMIGIALVWPVLIGWWSIKGLFLLGREEIQAAIQEYQQLPE